MNLIKHMPDDSQDIQSVIVHQRYAARPTSLAKLCLADFVSKFRICYTSKNEFDVLMIVMAVRRKDKQKIFFLNWKCNN